MRIKCPHCNGKGFSELNSAVNMTCGWCMGQGELDLEIVPTEPLTEQEYIQTCNTEQLADILLHIADSCYWAGFFKGKEDADGYDDDYCLINQNIVEWLKQPHTDS